MPLPRMTTRRWMIAVAAVAVWLAIAVAQSRWWRSMPQRAAEYSARAAEHLRLARELPGGEDRVTAVDLRAPDPRAIYHRKVADKWLRAARHPWLPVSPDPPERPSRESDP